jgi:hypothetical protein
MPGSPATPFPSVMKSTIATAPPELQISFDSSELCLAISLTQLAAYFLTK